MELKKVLIADNDSPTRILLSAAISQWGYEVIEAADGEEAWEIAKDPLGPRLLILDLLMPKLDGIEICTRIRKKLSWQPYIILLTQVSGAVNVIKGLEAGADEFLTKPCNMPELRSRLIIGTRIITYQSEIEEQKIKLQNILSSLSTILLVAKKAFTDDTVPEKNKEFQKELKNFIEIVDNLCHDFSA